MSSVFDVQTVIRGGRLVVVGALGGEVVVPLVRVEAPVFVQVHLGDPDEILQGGWDVLESQVAVLGGAVRLRLEGQDGGGVGEWPVTELPAAEPYLVHTWVVPGAAVEQPHDSYLVCLQRAAQAEEAALSAQAAAVDEGPGRLPAWPVEASGPTGHLDVDYGCVALIGVPDAQVVFDELDDADWTDDGWAVGGRVLRLAPVSEYGAADVRVVLGGVPSGLDPAWRDQGSRIARLQREVFVATMGDGEDRDPQLVATLPQAGHHRVQEYAAQGHVPSGEPDRYLVVIEPVDEPGR